jgi:hypothetical protein
MATFGAPWQGPRWAALVSLLVAVAIGAVIWWLMAEAVPVPPAVTQVDSPRGSMQAASDPNVVEWTFRVACFYQARKHLPESLEELQQSGIPDGSALPATTADGWPLRYERKGDRTYMLAFTRPTFETGEIAEVTIPEEAPASMPAMDTESLRAWWGLEHEKLTTREMLRGLRGAGAGR